MIPILLILLVLERPIDESEGIRRLDNFLDEGRFSDCRRTDHKDVQDLELGVGGVVRAVIRHIF